MVSILELWLPILLSSVAVFILSSIIHMVLPYHRTDYKKLPSEDSLMDSLRKANIPPGDYMFPFSSDNKERNSKEYKDKLEKGPMGRVTIFPAGTNFMGSSLAMWFIYTIIVGIFAAYVAGRALSAGADYLAVFRFAGVTSFVGYTLALLQDNIWYKKSWATTIKNIIDGLIYALFTGGIFGWLWPGITS